MKSSYQTIHSKQYYLKPGFLVPAPHEAAKSTKTKTEKRQTQEKTIA
jgi:hypothetical protein